MAQHGLGPFDRPATSGTARPLPYRADIDGLRAIAVLPVIFFHAGSAGFGGGFVGVDIFFVISGFLITGIIWRELNDDKHSLVAFYERRVRRIFPALAVLLAAVLVASAVILLPRDFARIPAAVGATLGFVSNVLFYTQADYFDAPSRWNPLVHTWSLAIEEQYYLLFPPFMAILFRRARRLLVPAIAAVALLSFALNVWGAYRSPTFTFYMAPTRVWELLAGSLLAVGFVPAVVGRRLREGLAAFGILLIAVAVFALSEHMAFPGVAALLPVIGSALVIHCGVGTAAGRLLALWPLRAIGLISYSLYLWHWPVLVFAEYRLGRPLEAGETALAIAFSIAIASVSWRYVELPFRDRSWLGRRALFGLAGAGAIVLAGAAMSAQMTDGWPARFSREALRLEATADDISPRRAECARSGANFIPPDRSCTYGAPVAPTIAVWGDSHSLELSQALGERAALHGVALVQFSSPGCGPLLSAQRKLVRDCLPWSRLVMDHLMRHPELATVILIMRTDRDEFRDDPRLADDFIRTAERLARAGRRAVIVHPVPTQPAPVPRLLALRAGQEQGMASAGVPMREFVERNRPFLERLDRLRSDNIAHVRPTDILCRDGLCRAWLPGRVLYHDDNHLSMSGARLVAPLFDPVLAQSPE